jgi:hypothetical protein
MSTAFSLHRLLSRIALSAMAVFAWVLVLDTKLASHVSLTAALIQVILLLLLSQVTLVLAAPAVAQLYRGGMVRLMIAGCIAHAAAWVLLGAALIGSAVPWSLAGFAVLSGFARAAYATPFSLIQYDMGADSYIHEFLYALVPLAAAIVFAQGTDAAAYTLFILAALMLFSAAFLLRFEAYEEFSWHYRDTFGMLLEPVHRRFVVDHLLKGYEAAVLFVVWPMFVYIILDHSYLVLGVLFTVSLLGLSALRQLFPHWGPSSPAAAAALAGGAWLARMVFVQPVPLILVQMAGTAGVPQRVRAHQLLSQDADNSTFLDEVTILKEISLGLGRASLCIAFIAALSFLPEFWALLSLFLSAALAAAFATYRTVAKH